MNDIVKSLLISFFLFSIGAALLYYILFTPAISDMVDSVMGTPSSEKTLGLDQFNKNPSFYLNQDVRVRGEFEKYSNKYNNCPVSVDKLTDNDGNEIRICAINKEFQQGEIYTLRGKIVRDISNSTGTEYYILMVE
jgi:hypothetical protein